MTDFGTPVFVDETVCLSPRFRYAGSFVLQPPFPVPCSKYACNHKDDEEYMQQRVLLKKGWSFCSPVIMVEAVYPSTAEPM